MKSELSKHQNYIEFIHKNVGLSTLNQYYKQMDALGSIILQKIYDLWNFTLKILSHNQLSFNKINAFVNAVSWWIHSTWHDYNTIDVHDSVSQYMVAFTILRVIVFTESYPVSDRVNSRPARERDLEYARLGTEPSIWSLDKCF